MLATPDTEHIPASVYPPAEDSYLFLDALPGEVTYLSDRFPSSSPAPLVVELGPGSGIITAFLTANAQAILGRSNALSIAVDISVAACKATEQTVKRHIETSGGSRSLGSASFAGCINGDLTTPLRPKSVDVLLFNPPYVPSDVVPQLEGLSTASEFERENALLAAATDGGADGMEVTHRVLESLPTVLSERGVAYILFCKRNKPERIMARIRALEGGRWTAEVVRESGRTGGLERLCIIRIARRRA